MVQSESVDTFRLMQGATLLRTNEAKIDQQAADQLHHSSGWEPEAIANLQASKFALDAGYSDLY